MSFRDFLTQEIGLSHLFMLDDETRDPRSNGLDTTGEVVSGSFVADPICHGAINSFRSQDNGTGRTDGFRVGSTTDINVGSDIWREYSIMLWFRADEIGEPTCVYEQGGGSNNQMIGLGLGRAITSQAADAGQPFLIAQSNFQAQANRPYFISHVWQHHTTHSGSGNRILLYINGVLNDTVELTGTSVFPSHTGDAVVGNTADSLQSYNGGVLPWLGRAKNINALGLGADISITETQARDIFERSVIPEVTIAADTVENQQAALDALAGQDFSGVNCAIRVIQATDATDYRLFVDGMTFGEDPNLRDISIQYVGPNTLTLECVNDTGIIETSAPPEVDLDGTNVLQGGGFVNVIVGDNTRLQTAGDLKNITTSRLILEASGDYRFENVIINEVENVSGGVIEIITDRDIPVVTNTGAGSDTNVVAESVISAPNNAPFNILAIRNDTGADIGFAEGVTSFTVQMPLGASISYALWVEGFETFVGSLTPSEQPVEIPQLQANTNIDLSINADPFLDDIEITLAPNDYSIVFGAPVTMNIEQMKAVIHQVTGREVSLRASIAAGPSSPALTIGSVTITINLPIVFLRRGDNLGLEDRIDLTGFINQEPARAINPTYVVNPSVDGLFVVIPSLQSAIDPTELARSVWADPSALLNLDHSRAANLQTQSTT